MFRQINESLIVDRVIGGLEQLIFVGWHGTKAGVQDRCSNRCSHRCLSLTCIYIYRCLLTQLEILQCKLDVIMVTTILFSMANILPNRQIIIRSA